MALGHTHRKLSLRTHCSCVSGPRTITRYNISPLPPAAPVTAVVFVGTATTAQESIQCFIEYRAFSPFYNLSPSPLPSHPSISKLSLFLSFPVYRPSSLLTGMRIQYKCLVPIYAFPEMKLLFPSSYTHLSVRDFYISAYSAAGKYVERSWEYINRSQTHVCGNRD